MMERKRPAVVNLSLGGPCDRNNCRKDPLVLAVEAIVAKGVVASLSGGNEGADACYGSPNAALTAVTSGTADENDHVPYFSNYGQCIDIFAP